MNGKFGFIFACAILMGAFASAQGYGGLGRDIPGFVAPDPTTILEFPKDDGAHPEFRIEWWYLTANLQDADGSRFGIQWTLFRTALRPGGGDGWDDGQFWMAHAALTSPTTHSSAEKFARGATGQAGVIAQPFEAWIDDWTLSATPDKPNQFSLTAGGEDFSFKIDLVDDGKRVFHGENGYSVKSLDGHASHYYSRPFLRADGQISVNGVWYNVFGDAWLDREWSSQPLSAGQSGWDWVGLSLDDGRRLMAARVRDGENTFHFGSLIGADGTTQNLANGEVELIPEGDDEPPTTWQVKVPKFGISTRITALNKDAWTGRVFSYWEGPVILEGSHQGRGYLEMTGYR